MSSEANNNSTQNDGVTSVVANGESGQVKSPCCHQCARRLTRANRPTPTLQHPYQLASQTKAPATGKGLMSLLTCAIVNASNLLTMTLAMVKAMQDYRNK